MKVVIVIKKEFKEIIRKKSFIIGTILLPVVFLGLIFLPAYVATKTAKISAKIIVIDFTNEVFFKLQREIKSREKKFLKLKTNLNTTNKVFEESLVDITFEKVELRDKTELNKVEKNLKEKIEKKEIFGYLIIPEDFFKNRKVILKAKNVSNIGLIETIRGALKKVAVEKILAMENFPKEKVSELTKNVQIETLKVEKGKEKKTQFFGEYMLSIFMLTMMFSVLLGYGQILMRSIIEEKRSRIVEIILSSIDSLTYFAGKVIGIGLSGLFQVAIWGVMLFGGYAYLMTYLPKDFKGLTINNKTIFFFIVFFIMGYFLYASLFAIAGAISQSEEEAQQFVQPLFFLLIIPFIFSFSSVQNPDSTISIVLSLIPFLTPIVMFLRVTVGSPPLWQVVLSMVFLFFTLYASIWAGAKIFRIGILSYGKKPTLHQLFTWLKVE